MPKKGGEDIKNTKDCNTILKECYAQYRIKLFNYCLARLDGAREDADDCVQDSFLVLQQKLNSRETIENPRITAKAVLTLSRTAIIILF